MCPEPSPLAQLMRLFPRVLVICGSFECARHSGGYWPHDVQDRITLVRFELVNRRLAARIGGALAAELGIAEPAIIPVGHRARLSSGTRRRLKERILPLAAHLHAVSLAADSGAVSTLILESDLKPLPENALTPPEVKELGRVLGEKKWELFRPTGYHRTFSADRFRLLNGTCNTACRCHRISPHLPVCRFRSQFEHATFLPDHARPGFALTCISPESHLHPYQRVCEVYAPSLGRGSGRESGPSPWPSLHRPPPQCASLRMPAYGSSASQLDRIRMGTVTNSTAARSPVYCEVNDSDVSRLGFEAQAVQAIVCQL